MTLKPSHLIAYCLLGIVCVLIGFIISQYRTLTKWKIAGTKCAFYVEDQRKVIKGLLR